MGTKLQILNYSFLIIFLFNNLIYFSFSLDIQLIDAIYNLLYHDLYLIYQNETICLSKSYKYSINTGFRITKKSNSPNNSFYYIENIRTNNTISISKNKEIISYIKEDNSKVNMSLWSFYKTKKNHYYIQNNNKCFLKVRNLSIYCENISIENASHFKLIKIYEEIKKNKLNIKLS